MSIPENQDRAEPFLKIGLNAALECVSASGDDADSFGLSSAVVLGKYFPDLVAPEEVRGVIETLRSAIEERTGALIVASIEVLGRFHSLELDVEFREEGSGEAVAIEIDLRRAGVLVSSPSENLPRSLVETMRDGVVEIDDEGRIAYANGGYSRLLGRPLAVLTGADPLEFVHADDLRRVSQFFRPGVRGRRQNHLVYRAKNMDGDWTCLEATASDFLDEYGRSNVVASIRDVTLREKARESLERHISLEARVAEVSRFFIDIDLDAIQEGIKSRLTVIADLAGADRSWMHSFATNEESDKESELFEWWRREELKGVSMSAAETVEAFPYSTGLIMSGRVYRVTRIDDLPEEAESERRDMLERGVRSILGIPIMSSGEFVGFLGFESFDREKDWPEETIMLLRMIGEIFYSALRRRQTAVKLKQSQAQLLQSQKMQAVGTLAGGIAHDFNNHLAVMLTNARFVRQEVEAEKEVLNAIDDFERSADHCAELTQSLLAFSRLSPIEILPVEVADLVESVEGLVRPLLPSSIDFELVLAPSLGFFAVDRVQIQQVLVNLLVNARDAMPDGGSIQMSACRRPISSAEAASLGLAADREEYVVLSVEDCGHGMSLETQSRVFEPFFTTKDVGQGTGLGLAMAYGIIRQSEGAIEIESELNEGAIFRVFLPGCEIPSTH